MINTVTITGADDSIHPQDLLELQNEFTFVEWAILFSTKKTGTPRYPSEHWIESFFDLSEKMLQTSAHLCGDYAKAIVLGDDSFLQLAGTHFSRIQINHNFTNNPVDIDKLHNVIRQHRPHDFILQKNKSNSMACRDIENTFYPNVHFLYDASGGRGTKINDTLGPVVFNHYTGYAGGISPENIESIIQSVNAKSGKKDIWIDMETHVRSDNDKQFDLKKVRKVLEIAEKYIWDIDE